MPKRSAKNQKSQTKLPELLVVTFVEDIEQAKEYETLLKNNQIPVVIKNQKDQTTNTLGIAVMVPEDYLDEAHVIIESQSAYDDFYDFAMEDHDEEDENEYEDDILDDNF